MAERGVLPGQRGAQSQGEDAVSDDQPAIQTLHQLVAFIHLQSKSVAVGRIPSLYRPALWLAPPMGPGGNASLYGSLNTFGPFAFAGRLGGEKARICFRSRTSASRDGPASLVGRCESGQQLREFGTEGTNSA